MRMISVACARCSCAVRHLNLRLSDRRYRQLVHQVREERQQRREFKEALKEPNSILFSADALCFVDHKYRSLIHQHKPILSNPIARRNPLCPVLLLSGNRAPRGSRFARVQIIHTALRCTFVTGFATVFFSCCMFVIFTALRSRTGRTCRSSPRRREHDLPPRCHSMCASSAARCCRASCRLALGSTRTKERWPSELAIHVALSVLCVAID